MPYLVKESLSVSRDVVILGDVIRRLMISGGGFTESRLTESRLKREINSSTLASKTCIL